MPRFLLATRNKGKLIELRGMLLHQSIELVSLDDAAIWDDVEETGHSFAENARLKAAEYSRRSGLYSIADDSGLEVAALDGRPGVFSARYAGTTSGYDVKIPSLLAEIDSADTADRSARFVSHIAVADPNGKIIHDAEGICDGSIALSPRGSHGFGYDPIFIPEGFDKTFGELDEQVKQTISHRSRAISKIMRFLLDFA